MYSIRFTIIAIGHCSCHLKVTLDAQLIEVISYCICSYIYVSFVRKLLFLTCFKQFLNVVCSNIYHFTCVYLIIIIKFSFVHMFIAFIIFNTMCVSILLCECHIRWNLARWYFGRTPFKEEIFSISLLYKFLMKQLPKLACVQCFILDICLMCSFMH